MRSLSALILMLILIASSWISSHFYGVSFGTRFQTYDWADAKIDEGSFQFSYSSVGSVGGPNTVYHFARRLAEPGSGMGLFAKYPVAKTVLGKLEFRKNIVNKFINIELSIPILFVFVVTLAFVAFYQFWAKRQAEQNAAEQPATSLQSKPK